MRKNDILVAGALILICSGCVSTGKITQHDFDSGYYNLKNQGARSSRVYANINEDSIFIHPLITIDKKESPDTSAVIVMKLSKTKIKTEKYLNKSRFTNNSIDIDLATILFKNRQPRDDVPAEFSADLNLAVFLGFRSDSYLIGSSSFPPHEKVSLIRQVGFDLGIFAGIGTTPVNSSNTNNKLPQQYDAMILQKGFAGFISYGKMSVGLALGFDNLMDRNKSSWIFNQKPYLGLVIGIADF